MHSSTDNQPGNGQVFPPAKITQPDEGQPMPVPTMPMPASAPPISLKHERPTTTMTPPPSPAIADAELLEQIRGELRKVCTDRINNSMANTLSWRERSDMLVGVLKNTAMFGLASRLVHVHAFADLEAPFAVTWSVAKEIGLPINAATLESAVAGRITGDPDWNCGTRKQGLTELLARVADADDVPDAARTLELLYRFIEQRTGKDRELIQLDQEMEQERLDTLATPYRPFPLDVFPPTVRDYCHAVIASVGCTDAFVTVPMLAMLAGTIGTARQLRIKHTWIEPAIIWAATVAPVSGDKSPGWKNALAPARKLEADKRRQHAAEMAGYKHALKSYEDRKKAKTLTSDDAEPLPPEASRLLVDDVTIEAVARVLESTPRGLLMQQEEIAAWPRSFGQYKNGRGGDVQRWLNIWGGDTLITDRATDEQRTRYIPRPAVSVAGTIQPDVLRKIATDELHECGFIARILLTAPPPGDNVDLNDNDLDPATYGRMCELIERLRSLAFDVTKEPTAPVMVELSPEAREVFRDFHRRQKQLGKDTQDPRRAGAYLKLVSYAARFALVIHEANNADGSQLTKGAIQTDEMTAAVKLADWFTYEVHRVYRLIEATRETKEQAARRQAIEFARSNKNTISVREAMKKVSGIGTTEAAKALLSGLAGDGVGEFKGRKNTHGPATWMLTLSQKYAVR